MAFSFKFPKLGGADKGDSAAPMTIAADMALPEPAAPKKMVLPEFLAGQSVLQQVINPAIK